MTRWLRAHVVRLERALCVALCAALVVAVAPATSLAWDRARPVASSRRRPAARRARPHRAHPHHRRGAHRARAARAAAARARVAVAATSYRLPLDRAWFTEERLTRRHHGHPAIDLMVPEGTPVYAAAGGRVAYTRDPRCGRGLRVAGVDGYEYVYCHGSRLDVADGQQVEAGTRLMLSGDTGSTAVPHLHFGVRVHGGRELCPHGLLRDWLAGVMTAPSDATPSSGCTP